MQVYLSLKLFAKLLWRQLLGQVCTQLLHAEVKGFAGESAPLEPHRV